MEEKYHHEASNHSIYSILFETSFCHDSSSESSPIMPDTFREHLTKDPRAFLHPESLQTIQISWSMLVLIFFSSPHSFSIGFRSKGTCSQWPFFMFVCGSLSCWKIQPWPITWFLVCQFLIVYLLVFYRIHNATYLNKISRISGRKMGPQHWRCSSIFYCTYGVLVCKTILSVSC